MANKQARSIKKVKPKHRAPKPRCAPAFIPMTKRQLARFNRAERYRLGN